MFKAFIKVRVFTFAKIVLLISCIFLLITSIIIWKNNPSLTTPRGQIAQVKLILPSTLAKELPNTVTRLWLSTLGRKAKPLRVNRTCAHHPNILTLNYHNKHWQFLKTPTGIIYLYKAYYDVRKNKHIRILTMSTNHQPNLHLFCQVWYDFLNNSRVPEIIPVKDMVRLNNTKYEKSIEMVIISCQTPWRLNTKTPLAVSLVLAECNNATNLLKVFYKPYRNKKFDLNICVEPLYYPKEDISRHLIEWIEIQKLRGVNILLTFYSIETESRTETVLRYYKNKDLIDVIPLSFPNFNSQIEPNATLEEIIEINHLAIHDCFYQSLYKYHYILPLSLRETIMLFQRKTWKKFFQIWHYTAFKVTNNNYVVFSCIPLLVLNKPPENFSSQFSFLNASFVQDITRSNLNCSRSLLNTRKVVLFNDNEPEVCLTKCEGYLAAHSEVSVLRVATNCMDSTSEICNGLKELPGINRHDFVIQNGNISSNLQKVHCELSQLFPNETCDEKSLKNEN